MLNNFQTGIYKSMNLFRRIYRYEHINIKWEENIGFLPIFRFQPSIHIFSPHKALQYSRLGLDYTLMDSKRVEQVS